MSTPEAARLIGADELRSALPPHAAVEAARAAMIALSRGEVDVPPRARWRQADCDAVVLAMFASSAAIGRYLVKTVSVYPGNATRGLPTVQGEAALYGRGDGRALARFDAEALTALRTAASTAAAVDALTPPGPARLTLFGAGALCEPLLEAIAAVRPLQHVVLVGRNRDKAAKVAASLRARLNLEIAAGDDASDLRQSNLIVTATTSATPLFEAAAIASSALVAGVGSFEPSRREVPGEFVRAAQVFVDSRAACASEAGDLILACGSPEEAARFVTELGEHLMAPGPVDFERPRFYKSVGNAAQDLYAAVAAFERLASFGSRISPPSLHESGR